MGGQGAGRARWRSGVVGSGGGGGGARHATDENARERERVCVCVCVRVPLVARISARHCVRASGRTVRRTQLHELLRHAIVPRGRAGSIDRRTQRRTARVLIAPTDERERSDRAPQPMRLEQQGAACRSATRCGRTASCSCHGVARHRPRIAGDAIGAFAQHRATAVSTTTMRACAHRSCIASHDRR